MVGRVPVGLSVVVVAYDMARELPRTLRSLGSDYQRGIDGDEYDVIVVDNGSRDATAERVRDAFPDVTVVALAENRGAVARTAGIEAAATPYVAFADDDSWWAPGSLGLAAACFERCPTLAVVAATILVGPDERTEKHIRSMLEDHALPEKERAELVRLINQTVFLVPVHCDLEAP